MFSVNALWISHSLRLPLNHIDGSPLTLMHHCYHRIQANEKRRRILEFLDKELYCSFWLPFLFCSNKFRFMVDRYMGTTQAFLIEHYNTLQTV